MIFSIYYYSTLHFLSARPPGMFTKNSVYIRHCHGKLVNYEMVAIFAERACASRSYVPSILEKYAAAHLSFLPKGFLVYNPSSVAGGLFPHSNQLMK